MKLTEQEVRYVAGLANLTLTEDEVHRMAHDLSDILTHVDKLNEVDTTDVGPMAQVLYEAEETATLRDDAPGTTLPNDVALVNAPRPGSGYFKVPKVIER